MQATADVDVHRLGEVWCSPVSPAFLFFDIRMWWSGFVRKDRRRGLRKLLESTASFNGLATVLCNLLYRGQVDCGCEAKVFVVTSCMILHPSTCIYTSSSHVALI